MKNNAPNGEVDYLLAAVSEEHDGGTEFSETAEAKETERPPYLKLFREDITNENDLMKAIDDLKSGEFEGILCEATLVEADVRAFLYQMPTNVFLAVAKAINPEYKGAGSEKEMDALAKYLYTMYFSAESRKRIKASESIFDNARKPEDDETDEVDLFGGDPDPEDPENKPNETDSRDTYTRDLIEELERVERERDELRALIDDANSKAREYLHEFEDIHDGAMELVEENKSLKAKLAEAEKEIERLKKEIDNIEIREIAKRHDTPEVTPTSINRRVVALLVAAGVLVGAIGGYMLKRAPKTKPFDCKAIVELTAGKASKVTGFKGPDCNNPEFFATNSDGNVDFYKQGENYIAVEFPGAPAVSAK